MIEISVIVPLYNPGKNIFRLLKSLKLQTFEDFEIILLDDGSKDNSEKYIKAFLDKSLKLKEKTTYIKKDNEGVALTRNMGLALSKGEYVMFVDQDDYVAKDYLETYHREVRNYDYVVGGYIRVNKDKKIIKTLNPNSGWFGKYLVTAPWAHIYKKSFLIDNNILFLNSPIGEDVYFNLLLSCYTTNAKVINYTGYRWFYNEESVSNSRQNKISSEVDILILLNALYERFLKLEDDENAYYYKEFMEYYILRYICWYFLYTVRNSKKEDVLNEYDRIFKWIKIRFPNYMNNKYIGLKGADGELFSYRIAVTSFYLLKKIRVLKTVLALLSMS